MGTTLKFCTEESILLQTVKSFKRLKIADPFLYSMGETKDTHIELKEDEGDAEMGDLR